MKKGLLYDVDNKLIAAINRITVNPMYSDSITLQALHEDLLDARKKLYELMKEVHNNA